MRPKRGAPDPDKPCYVCGEPSIAKDLCSGHYMRWRRGLDVEVQLNTYVKQDREYWENRGSKTGCPGETQIGDNHTGVPDRSPREDQNGVVVDFAEL
jgi:hypothetical protein